MNNKSPQVNKRKKSLTPRVLLHGDQDEPMKDKGSARRRLELPGDTSDDNNSRDNDVDVELPPPPPLTEYEIEKMRKIQENEKLYQTLGLPSLVSSVRHDLAQNIKGKCKQVKGKPGKCKDHEGGEEYIPENEGEDESDDSMERIRAAKVKKNYQDRELVRKPMQAFKLGKSRK